MHWYNQAWFITFVIITGIFIICVGVLLLPKQEDNYSDIAETRFYKDGKLIAIVYGMGDISMEYDKKVYIGEH